MLKKLLFVFLAALTLSGMFALTAGDIAIIGVNADATKSMAFVALEDIPASTVITFSDNAWNATTETWRSGEGSFEWSNTSSTPKGTVVVITLATTFSTTVGSVTTNASFSLSATGDQILAYEGSTAPTTNSATSWLYGFSLENWAWGNNSNTSDIPTALAGYSAAMTTSTTEIDNAYFANGATAQTDVSVSGTKAALIALFTDTSKYYKNDTGPLTFPTYTVSVSSAGTPSILVSGALTAFSTYTGTASTPQSYTVSGSNLTANIIVTPPTGYEMSSNGTTYLSSLTLASTYDGLVYIRLTGTTAGTFNGNITHTSTGATQVDKAVSGTVSNPAPVIHTTGTLNAFSTETGTPSTAQTYTLSGEFLTADIIVTPPAGYELSTNGSTYLSSLTLASTFNNLVYVRLTGTTEGTYNGNITHTSTGATQVDLAVSGEVIAPVVPTLLLEENFAYTVGTTAVSNGWSAHSGAGTAQPLVDATNLSYTNYPPNAGGSVRTTGVTGEDISKGFTQQTSGEVYCGFLLRITSIPTVTQDYFFHLGDAAVPGGGTNFRGRLIAQRDASNAIRFALSKGTTSTSVTPWTGGTYASGTYDYAMDTTYMMVLKYKVIPGAANDEVYLWINPTDTVNEPAYTLFLGSADTTSDLANIGSVAIRQSANTPAAYYDGIRITNDWAQLWEEAPTPIIVTEGVPDPVYNISGNPSEEVSSYNLSGTNLMGNINLVAPEHFEISTSATEGWNTSLSVPYNYNAPIYVRMNSNVVGEHSGNITHNSAGAAEVLVRAEGETFAPNVVWNIIQSLTAFSAEAGTASDAQSYSMSATNATGNITVSVTTPFELSTTGTGGWAASLDLLSTFNSNIYVRMNSATAGTFNANIVHSTANATNYDLPISGTATPPAGNYATDLFFSEYIEGSSNNKAIEIFNGTGLPVDLSAYSVKLGSNGGTWGNTLALTGTLANNDVYVIANAGANATILAASDVTSTVTYYNGDDALGLFKNEVQIDAFGTYPSTTGVYWAVAGTTGASLNHTLVRKPTVVEGNLDWTASAGTNADDSEWVVQAIDYVTDLGVHTFTPGMELTGAPVFNPAAGLYYAPINVGITSTTVGATIRYTTDGTDPSETAGTIYSDLIPISATTTLKAIAYASGYAPSAVMTAVYNYPVLVSNIAQLRAQAQGSTVYRLTGEAVLTFQQSTSRHPKYFQDATGAIVIDDPSAVISTTYSLYDGVTGITGTLGNYSNLIQFTPVADPGAATSTGNVIVPEERTFASLVADDQAKLIKVMDVTIDPTTVNFGTAAENINATDPTTTLVMRTFASTDYSGTAIPVAPVNLTCLVGQFGTTMQISPRFLADFEAIGGLEIPVVAITEAGGTITLTWDAVAGATSYRIEHSDNPYAGYTTLNSTANLNYQVAAGPMKWFRVFAVQ